MCYSFVKNWQNWRLTVFWFDYLICMLYNICIVLLQKIYYDDQSSTSQNDSRSLDESIRQGDLLWFQLGNIARKLLYTVPSFTFM